MDKDCPANGKECMNGGKLNQFAKVCRSCPKSQNSKSVHKFNAESLKKAIENQQSRLDDIETTDHSLKTTHMAAHRDVVQVSPDYDPLFFISRNESIVKRLSNTTVCQLSKRNISTLMTSLDLQV